MKILLSLICLFKISNFAYSEVKIGNLLALTGPIPTISELMGEAIDLAVEHINDQGALFEENQKLVVIRKDSKCDPLEVITSAKELVEIERVSGIIGPVCSIPTISQAEEVSIPSGVVTITMSASSKKISSFELNSDLVFRTVSSYSHQGAILAKVAMMKKIDNVVILYENDKSNENLVNSFVKRYENLGGEVSHILSFEKGKDSYLNDTSILRKKSENLILISNDLESTITVLNGLKKDNMFDIILGSEGLLRQKLINEIDSELIKKLSVISPAYDLDSLAFKEWEKYANTAGIEATTPFLPNAYDATFILGLAIEMAGSEDLKKIATSIRDIANSPGEKILPGEWEKAKLLISSGESIDYIGASGKIQFDDKGDVIGNYSINIIADTSWKSIIIDQ